MLVGGIWALISMRGSLLSGVKAGLSRAAQAGEYDHREHDAPMRLVLSLVGLFIIPIFILYQEIVGAVGVALAMTLIMIVAGFLFSSVAAYMAGLVGSSNNPVSGITIATILLTSLLLLWMLGADSASGPTAAIMVGAVVCCAAAIGGDNLQDLKAGYLVGATPWKQQLMQAVGVIAAVLVMAPILNLLVQAYGIGAPTPEQPNALLAPQATLMASVADGVFGDSLPRGMIFGGAIIGMFMIIVDEYLKRIGAAWRAPVLAVAVGVYLPLELSVPIFVGGLIAHFAGRYFRVHGGDGESARRAGTLFAAGLITGEALIGIFMAIPIVITSNPDVIALNVTWPSAAIPALLGLAVVGGVCAALYRTATHLSA